MYKEKKAKDYLPVPTNEDDILMFSMITEEKGLEEYVRLKQLIQLVPHCLRSPTAKLSTGE